MKSHLSDAELAAQIAVGAGQILLGVRHAHLLSGGALGNTGDRMAQTWIATVLRRHRPQDAILSEEAADVGDRSSTSRVWIIDPLDGTNEFVSGTSNWAVHIGLTVDGIVKDAAVSLPATGELFRSDAMTPPTGPLSGKLVTARWRGSYESNWVANQLDLQAVPMGSAGAKAMAVVRGDADAYIHSGGQYEWDNCAPVGIALAAGLHCSRLDGSDIVYNNPDPYMPDFVICRTEIGKEVLRSLQRIH